MLRVMLLVGVSRGGDASGEVVVSEWNGKCVCVTVPTHLLTMWDLTSCDLTTCDSSLRITCDLTLLRFHRFYHGTD